MKRFFSIIIFLLSTYLCFGQDIKLFTPIKELIQLEDDIASPFYIKGHFAGVLDSTKLIILVEEDDYIIPIQLQKRDLGAEKRFLALNLQEGDLIVIKGVLDNILLRFDDLEVYRGLVDAQIINENDVPEKELDTAIDKDRLTIEDLDVKPLFNGGGADKFSYWVNSQLKYPKLARENGVQGRITLQFTIETDGSVTDVKVLRGVDELLDREAIRVVSSSPKWTPGYIDDKPVRVTYTFPVIFQLQ